MKEIILVTLTATVIVWFTIGTGLAFSLSGYKFIEDNKTPRQLALYALSLLIAWPVVGALKIAKLLIANEWEKDA